MSAFYTHHPNVSTTFTHLFMSTHINNMLLISDQSGIIIKSDMLLLSLSFSSVSSHSNNHVSFDEKYTQMFSGQFQNDQYEINQTLSNKN